MVLLLIGALTAKPHAFRTRSWELENIETIDLFDSLCSNIRIDVKNSDIVRILPVNNQYINEE
jgi:NADH-quinone oxidoreductase subunit G